MKTRRVMVTFELETDIPSKYLKDRNWWYDDFGFAFDTERQESKIIQIQVNAIKPTPKKKSRR